MAETPPVPPVPEANGLRIVCGTWNVNALDAYNFDHYLLRDWLCNQEEAPDIFSICIQEIVQLTDPGNYINMSPGSITKSEIQMGHWTNMMFELIKEHYPDNYFRVLEVKSCVGTMLCIIVQSYLIQKISQLKTKVVSLGRGGLGNKAAVIVRFDLLAERGVSKSICFVGVHLSANSSNNGKRIDDLGKIFKSDILVLEHDIVLCFGDLNFRVDTLTPAQAVQMIDDGELDELFKHDQLRKLMTGKNTLLAGFQEGTVDFKPTFKYIVDTDDFLLRKGKGKGKKKVRVPSWCDRVLFRGEKEDFELVEYYSCQDVILSDHKPVAACFYFEEIRNKHFELAQRLSSAESDFYVITSSDVFPGSITTQGVVAKSEYEAVIPEEISYEVGDVIEIIPEEMLFVDGWLCGRVKKTGDIGYFNGHSDNVDMLGIMDAEFTSKELTLAAKISAMRHHNFKILADLDDARANEAKPKVRRSPSIPFIRRSKKSQVSRVNQSLSGLHRGSSFIGSVKRGDSFITATTDRTHGSSSFARTFSRIIGTGARKRQLNAIVVRSIKGYSTKETDELSFGVGALLIVISRRSPTSKWWYCRHLATDDEGLVPSDYFPLSLEMKY